MVYDEDSLSHLHSIILIQVIIFSHCTPINSLSLCLSISPSLFCPFPASSSSSFFSFCKTFPFATLLLLSIYCNTKRPNPQLNSQSDSLSVEICVYRLLFSFSPSLFLIPDFAGLSFPLSRYYPFPFYCPFRSHMSLLSIFQCANHSIPMDRSTGEIPLLFSTSVCVYMSVNDCFSCGLCISFRSPHVYFVCDKERRKEKRMMES